MKISIIAALSTFFFASTLYSKACAAKSEVLVSHEKRKLKVKDQILDVIVSDIPTRNSLRPLLVIAPAKKYLMDGRLFERLANEAASLGFYVVRFNWSFTKRGVEPKLDLKTEANELSAVMEHYVKEPFIDSKKVVLAAKSFGSKVAMHGPYKAASAVLLMTPNCDAKETFSEIYGPLLGGKKILNITISTSDPNCDVNQIYRSANIFDKDRVTIHTLYGGHNFENSDGRDFNENTAVSSMVNWLHNLILTP
jgi:alpha/beta superfamily hydrolase